MPAESGPDPAEKHIDNEHPSILYRLFGIRRSLLIVLGFALCALGADLAIALRESPQGVYRKSISPKLAKIWSLRNRDDLQCVLFDALTYPDRFSADEICTLTASNITAEESSEWPEEIDAWDIAYAKSNGFIPKDIQKLVDRARGNTDVISMIVRKPRFDSIEKLLSYNSDISLNDAYVFAYPHGTHFLPRFTYSSVANSVSPATVDRYKELGLYPRFRADDIVLFENNGFTPEEVVACDNSLGVEDCAQLLYEMKERQRLLRESQQE